MRANSDGPLPPRTRQLTAPASNLQREPEPLAEALAQSRDLAWIWRIPMVPKCHTVPAVGGTLNE